jgi:hypothetical protein
LGHPNPNPAPSVSLNPFGVPSGPIFQVGQNPASVHEASIGSKYSVFEGFSDRATMAPKIQFGDESQPKASNTLSGFKQTLFL